MGNGDWLCTAEAASQHAIALPFFLEIKLSAGQEDINRSGVHLLENVLKGKWLIPHAHPLVSFLPTGTQKLLPRVIELRSLTT